MDFKDDFEFQFDQPHPENTLADDTEFIGLAKPINKLICSCPKCSAEMELDLPEGEQQVINTTCAVCNAPVSIIRESCANRAHRRSREISCVRCGSRLEHNPHCPSCGVLFPDYFVTMSPEDARSRARSKKFADFRQSIKRFNPSFYFDFIRKPTEQQQRRPGARSATGKHPSQTLVNPRMLRLIIALLVLIALAGGGSYAFNLHQRQQQFAENYFKAIYGINAGNEFTLNACARMIDDGKTAAAGLNFTPRLNEKEATKANKIQLEVDKLIRQMGTPPAKFVPAHQKLVQLRGAYQKSLDLAAAPPSTIQALTSAADQAGAGFSAAARDLKSALPDTLKDDDFEKAKQKYRGLKEF
jgi:hypothetical protein